MSTKTPKAGNITSVCETVADIPFPKSSGLTRSEQKQGDTTTTRFTTQEGESITYVIRDTPQGKHYTVTADNGQEKSTMTYQQGDKMTYSGGKEQFERVVSFVAGNDKTLARRLGGFSTPSKSLHETAIPVELALLPPAPDQSPSKSSSRPASAPPSKAPGTSTTVIVNGRDVTVETHNPAQGGKVTAQHFHDGKPTDKPALPLASELTTRLTNQPSDLDKLAGLIPSEDLRRIQDAMRGNGNVSGGTVTIKAPRVAQAR